MNELGEEGRAETERTWGPRRKIENVRSQQPKKTERTRDVGAGVKKAGSCNTERNELDRRPSSIVTHSRSTEPQQRENGGFDVNKRTRNCSAANGETSRSSTFAFSFLSLAGGSSTTTGRRRAPLSQIKSCSGELQRCKSSFISDQQLHR